MPNYDFITKNRVGKKNLFCFCIVAIDRNQSSFSSKKVGWIFPTWEIQLLLMWFYPLIDQSKRLTHSGIHVKKMSSMIKSFQKPTVFTITTTVIGTIYARHLVHTLSIINKQRSNCRLCSWGLFSKLLIVY